MRRLVLNGRWHAGGKPSPNSAPVYSGPLGGLKQLPCRTCSCSSCSNQAQGLCKADTGMLISRATRKEK